MAIQVALRHTTHYRYDRPVLLGPQIIRLRPTPHCRTAIRDYTLEVNPSQHRIHWQQDPHANFVARLFFPEPATEFTVAVALTAELTPVNPFDFYLDLGASQFPFKYDVQTASELCAFLGAEPAGPNLASFLADISREPAETMDFLVALNRRLQEQIAYIRRLDPGIQSSEETLDLGCGSCRDSAWLMVQIARHLGLAARFVSGYLIQLEGEGQPEDSADLHAWAEIYLPGAGWVGFDPTSALLSAEGHIPLACTPEPSRAAPISGQVSLSEVEFQYEMSVARL